MRGKQIQQTNTTMEYGVQLENQTMPREAAPMRPHRSSTAQSPVFLAANRAFR
jgi:hypothetical protein